jgi:response regulator RpfG family c-di-GMP phosphodiesterase
VRSFAVLDIVDALRSDYIYRKAWPKINRGDIRHRAGKYFHPRIAERFPGMIWTVPRRPVEMERARGKTGGSGASMVYCIEA